MIHSTNSNGEDPDGAVGISWYRPDNFEQCLAVFDDASEMHDTYKDWLADAELTEATAKKALKEAQEALDLAVFKHYPTLDEKAIKTLLIEDKWHATLQGRIEDEIERITAQLANRIKELDERYAEPLSQIVDEVETLSQKVQAHLQAMGVA